MFDSQRKTFEDFLLGYKHGVYVFTTDTCAICSDYKKSIEYINNGNLYFVEVNTSKEKDICYKLFDRAAFPLTVAYKDNEIDFVRAGMLFDTQMAEIFKFLEPFGDKPLSKIEEKQRIAKAKSRCLLTYYVFPPDTDESIKKRWMNELAIEYNELPIDIETVGVGLDDDRREHLLEGNFKFAKMVVFTDGETNIYNQFAQRIIIAYSILNKDVTFIKRRLDDYDNSSKK